MKLFVCVPVPPWVSSSAVETWAARARQALAEAGVDGELLVAIHENRFRHVPRGATPVLIPDKHRQVAAPTPGRSESENLREMYGVEALMRVELLRKVLQQGGALAMVWFLGVNVAPSGRDLAAALGLVSSNEADVVFAPLPPPGRGQPGPAEVFVRVRSRPREEKTQISLTTTELAEAALPPSAQGDGGEKDLSYPAVGARDLDWALAELRIFSLIRMQITRLPVTSVTVAAAAEGGDRLRVLGRGGGTPIEGVGPAWYLGAARAGVRTRALRSPASRRHPENFD